MGEQAMKKRAVQIWVDDEFKTFLKTESAMEKMSLYDYTKKLTCDLKKKKGSDFDFKI